MMSNSEFILFEQNCELKRLNVLCQGVVFVFLVHSFVARTFYQKLACRVFSLCIDICHFRFFVPQGVSSGSGSIYGRDTDLYRHKISDFVNFLLKNAEKISIFKFGHSITSLSVHTQTGRPNGEFTCIPIYCHAISCWYFDISH